MWRRSRSPRWPLAPRFRGESSLTTGPTRGRNACTRTGRRAAHGAARVARRGHADVRARSTSRTARGPASRARARRAACRARARDRGVAALAARGARAARRRGTAREAGGEALGLSERAVKSRLHRARVALRETLAPHAASAAGAQRCRHGAAGESLSGGRTRPRRVREARGPREELPGLRRDCATLKTRWSAAARGGRETARADPRPAPAGHPSGGR